MPYLLMMMNKKRFVFSGHRIEMPNTTRKAVKARNILMGVAVFQKGVVEGEVLIEQIKNGVKITATFTKMPPGKHGFHIHNAGDLRGEGCKGACSHYHVGPPKQHGPAPEKSKDRHTGDLGNIELKGESAHYSYIVKGTSVKELLGRSFIVHADEDDLGLGAYDDSKTTGHSGARIGCAIVGRSTKCD
jgi:Cu-Zn family superoxide dismutase